MAFVPVPKDLNRVKTKVMFNLTKRQLICFSIAAAVGVPIFFLAKARLDLSTAAMLMVVIMLPFIFFALYEKDGQPAEKYLYHIVQSMFCLLYTSFHLSVTQTKRSAGQSAIASAAYRSGEKLYSEYYGEYSDYTRKGGVICSNILLPSHAPPEYADRQTLWNAVEKAERGKNAQLAYSFDIALQNEFSLEENIALARQFLLEQFVSRGMVVDFAVHQPDREDGGIPNPHFHVLCPIRPIEQNGKWGCKQHRVYELDEDGNRIRDADGNFVFNAVPTTDWGSPETLEYWRQTWAELCNAKFAEKGLDVSIDHRSYERQGVELLPTVHEGATVRAMEKKGIRTEKGEFNRWIKATNAVIRDIKKKIALLFDWIAEAKVELAKPQAPDLVSLLNAYYTQRRAGAYSQKGKISNLKAVSYTHLRINEDVVLSLVSEMLKAIAEYAKHDRAKFVRVVQEAQSSQQTAEVKKQRIRLATAKQRVSELEVLLCKIYEDNILGKLSDSRYATLDAQYEKEQTELTAEISVLEKAIKSYEKHEKDADRFIALIDKYENFDKLTIAMLNEFIEKILVHERDLSLIHIFLNGLGATFEDTGITYTLQDVWYETTTDNMQQNYYELNSYVEKPIYIFMTLQAENKDTVEHIFYINDGIIMVFPKSNKVQSAEFTYQDHVTDPIPHNHDYAVCRLAAGEKETYTIAFETESTFADYNPIYLNWQCFPKGMFEDTVEGDMHEVWIKLPELESR